MLRSALRGPRREGGTVITMSPADTARYRQIADDIRTRIESGELPPGWTFPGELALAAEHGVARGTVVRAFDALRAEGLVETIAGRGTQVRAQRPLQDLGPSRYRTGWGDEIEHYEIDRCPASPALAQLLHVDVDAPLLRQRSVHRAGSRRRMVTSHIPLAVVAGSEPAFGTARAGENVEQLAATGVHVDDIWETLECRPPTEGEARTLQIPTSARVMAMTRWMTAGGLRVETADIVMPADQVRLVYRITP